MSEPKADDALVRAGGIAKKSAKTDPATTGELVALSFVHPALDGRTVVRLVEGSLDTATTAEMNVLGFEAAAEKIAVGRTRKRALGFPAWALVHHPAKARFALEVMREFRKGATRAKTKPGHAKDAFMEIAKKLERSVPAFMPSYWEEVGRTFLAEDATNLAAQAFEKARTAERAYKLPVDEDLRAAAYLEFSAAGAVPAKSLAGYADDLLAAFGGKEAEKRFLELNIQRIKAGTPPWTGLAKELSKLAKAAKRGDDAEAAFLTEVLASPSLKKAPPDFWAAYRETLMKLAAGSDEAKMRVIWLFPEPRSFPKFLPTWLELLERIGAVDAVTKSGEAARFVAALTRFVTFSDEWGGREEPIAPAYFEILAKLAPVLAKSGEPVAIGSYERWGDDGSYSPDVLEAALGLGLTLARPKGEDPSIDLGDAFVRDPVALAEHAEYGPLLVKAVGNQFGQEDFEARAKGKKGLVTARRNHLMGVIAKLADGALPAMKDELDTLSNCTSAATFAEFPEAAAAIEKVDVGRAFARTLRGGVIDELTWPEYEATLAELAGPKVEIQLHGTRQHPIVRAGRKIVIFEGKKRLEERDLPPIAKDPNHVLYIDGDVLVAFYDSKARQNQAVWASKAKEPFPFDTWRQGSPEVVGLPGGGVTTGEGVAIHKGDTPAKVRFKDFATDGTTFWSGRGTYDERLQLLELDPVTGKTGRPSWPAFVREASEKTDRFALREVQLMPLAGADGALTGRKDGLVGRYVRRDEKTDDVEITRVDGKTWTGKFTPDALLDFPGMDDLLAVSISSSWSDETSDEISIRHDHESGYPSAEFGDDKWKSAAFPLMPREGWLDYLSFRDEASSRALRAVSDEAARAIVAAAAEDDEDEDDEITHALAAVKKHLPGVKNEILQRGVAIIAKVAASNVSELASLQDRGGGDGATDDAVAEALPHFPTEGYEDGFCTTDMTATAAAFLEKKRGKLTASRIEWERQIEHFAKVVCFALTRPAVSDEARATLRQLAEGIAASGLLGLTVTRAELAVKTGSSFLDRPKGKDTWFATVGDSVVFARIVDEDEDEPTQKVRVLAQGATFAVPADATLGSSSTITIPDDRALVADVLRELDARGPVPHDSAAGAIVATETILSAPEAILILAGLPKWGEYRSDFLGKELRATLDLKQADASRAKAKLRELAEGQLFSLLVGAASLTDAKAFWAPATDENGSARALVRAAKSVFGKTVAVREELVSAVEKECQVPIPVRKALGMLLTASEAENKLLTPRPPPVKWFQIGNDGDFFSAEVVAAIGQLVPFVATSLPVGDEYRAAVPALWDRMKKNLEAPDFLLPLGDRYEDDPKKAAAIVEGVGGKKVQFDTSVEDQHEGRDNGTVLAIATGEESVELGLRTSSLRAHRAAVLPYLTGKDSEGDDIYGIDGAKAAYYLLSKECEELVESIRSSKAPEGSYELDPRVSAKRTVKDLAEAAGLDENAAALYLQLLALPNPTKKLVMLWNGWKASEYDAAAQVLVKKKLVVEGKRERAGRDIFLPGGWEKKSRGVSMETYKIDTFDRVSFEEARVTVAPKTLYARAYARYAGGEKPGFEDVTKKKKK